jgi:hypothetical protein
VADTVVPVFGNLDAWLATVPPPMVCAIVTLVIGLESMGVPLPGELALLSAAGVSPRHCWWSPTIAAGRSQDNRVTPAVVEGTRRRRL